LIQSSRSSFAVRSRLVEVMPVFAPDDEFRAR
jgi:hypothetical protein